MSRIAGKVLVTSVAIERDRDAGSGHARQIISRDRGRIRVRLAVMPNEERQDRGSFRLDDEFVVLGAPALRHLARVRDFVVLARIKTDSEGAHLLVRNIRHQPDDDARIHPAGKEHANRDIADEALADGVTQFLA